MVPGDAKAVVVQGLDSGGLPGPLLSRCLGQDSVHSMSLPPPFVIQDVCFLFIFPTCSVQSRFLVSKD